MMETIVLCPLTLEDCEDVARIAKESLPEHWSLAGIQDTLKYDNNIYYVARDKESDRILGFAGIMIIADEAELLNIAISKQYRAKGIGQLLMEQLLEEATNAGAKRLLLEVRESNQVAKDFYRKNAFSVIGERKNYYSNPMESAIIMEKWLE